MLCIHVSRQRHQAISGCDERANCPIPLSAVYVQVAVVHEIYMSKYEINPDAKALRDIRHYNCIGE